MASGSGGSNAIGWAVLGFLAGVAATLGVLVFLTPGHGRHREMQPAAAPAAIPPPAETAREARPPRPEPSAKPPTPSVAAADIDQQVQEDAAAAGMTSRRKPAPN